MKLTDLRILGVVAAATLCFSSMAQAAIILNPEADTEIRYNNTADRSSSGFINIKNSGDASAVTRKGYFSFDLSSFTSGTATAASEFKIVLQSLTGVDFDSGNNFLNVYGLNDATGVGTGFGEDWGVNQTTMTYNTSTGGFWVAPANDIASGNSVIEGTNAFEATLLGTIAIPDSPILGQEYTFTGSSLADFLNADTNNLATLILTRGGGGNSGSNFSPGSVENTNAARRPTLTITAVPEPSSLAMLGLAGVTMIVRRRRK